MIRIVYVLITTFILIFATQASAVEVYQCKGEVGNGYDKWRPEHKVYVRKNVTFAVQCSLWQQYIEGGANCTASIDGSGREGYYLGSGANKSFHFNGDDPLGGGKYTVSTGTLFFKVGDGYGGTNINETQRWFEGKCIRSK
tara:strand:- start:1546 stop:1968 length:423 start_codon:yes stop_codon:yes gene_type:complete